MMISRAVDLAVFGVCAGVTGVWGVFFDPEKLYSFLLFVGLAVWLHRQSSQGPAKDARALSQIKAVFYAQGLQHGAARKEDDLSERLT